MATFLVRHWQRIGTVGSERLRATTLHDDTCPCSVTIKPTETPLLCVGWRFRLITLWTESILGHEWRHEFGNWHSQRRLLSTPL